MNIYTYIFKTNYLVGKQERKFPEVINLEMICHINKIGAQVL
jgi:hypothetical protein